MSRPQCNSHHSSSGTALTGATGKTDAGSFQVQANALETLCATAVVVGLKWPAVSTATSYTVARNGSPLGSTSLLTYTDQKLSSTPTSYTYAVTAFDGTTQLSTLSGEVTTTTPTPTGDAAYCPSTVIASMTWNWGSGFNQQNGSDLWPTTWGADGNIYAFFGDGGGFFGTDQSGRASFGVGEITGSTPQITSTNATNVYGGFDTSHASTINGKANGLIAIGSNFYALGSIWQPGEGGPSNAPNHQELIYSNGNAYSRRYGGELHRQRRQLRLHLPGQGSEYGTSDQVRLPGLYRRECGRSSPVEFHLVKYATDLQRHRPKVPIHRKSCLQFSSQALYCYGTGLCESSSIL